MAKKNSTAKDTELSLSFFGKVAALFRSETVHFVIGLVLVIFSVYLLLAFSSFFFTGAADQSIIDGGSAQELISTNNGVKNYAGSRGAQLASYLINDCFGVSSFLILVFLAVAGLKLMRVRVVREDCEVIEINGDEFLSILDAEPSLVKRMLDIAMRRLFRAQKRESALAFLGAPARIARLLVEMDEADKQESDKGYITLSQEELAQRTGLTRQTVSNNLGYWRREDWLLTGRGRIMLLNRAAIRRIAEESLI